MVEVGERILVEELREGVAPLGQPAVDPPHVPRQPPEVGGVERAARTLEREEGRDLADALPRGRAAGLALLLDALHVEEVRARAGLDRMRRGLRVGREAAEVARVAQRQEPVGEQALGHDGAGQAQHAGHLEHDGVVGQVRHVEEQAVRHPPVDQHLPDHVREDVIVVHVVLHRAQGVRLVGVDVGAPVQVVDEGLHLVEEVGRLEERLPRPGPALPLEEVPLAAVAGVEPGERRGLHVRRHVAHVQRDLDVVGPGHQPREDVVGVGRRRHHHEADRHAGRTIDQSSGSPRASARAARRPSTAGRCRGASPLPGRIERTSASPSTAPSATSRTT